jgi:hypothetical protein
MTYKPWSVGRLGRQPNTSYCSVAMARSRWSLDFLIELTIFRVGSVMKGLLILVVFVSCSESL